MMSLAYVHPDRVPVEWPVLEPLLARVAAVEACDLDLKAMRDLLDRGHAMLLVVADGPAASAAGLIQIRNFESEGRRELWILALGGSARPGAWRDVLGRVEHIARAEGCARVCFVGRAAWRRLAPDYHAEPCERGTFYSRDPRH